MNRKKLLTYAFISRFYFGHHISRLWRSRRWQEGELDKFLDNYRGDRILPFTPEERAALPGFQSCVSCGLCTNACLLAASPGNLLSGHTVDPRLVAVAWSRAIPEFWSAQGLLEHCKECRLCEEICPTDTPLKRMVRFAADKSREGTPD
ncbi:MAG: 4Fe-4S dicluster domain-containing protein [Myxococcota bacterium]